MLKYNIYNMILKKCILIILLIIQVIIFYSIYTKLTCKGKNTNKILERYNNTCKLENCEVNKNLPDNFDSIFMGPDGIIHVFKNCCTWQFTINSKGEYTKINNFPKLISDVWKGIPSDNNCVFYMFNNQPTVYFIQFNVVYSIDYFTKQMYFKQRPISDVWSGIPNNVNAAFLYNKILYFFKNDSIYRYFIENDTLSNNSKYFENCPENIDGCFINDYDLTPDLVPILYLFKGKNYYKLKLSSKPEKIDFKNNLIESIRLPLKINTEILKYTGSNQKYIVPQTGLYKITAYGASAGYGGLGSKMVGKFKLNKNDILDIKVGGKGKIICNSGNCTKYDDNTDINASSGGGKTEVTHENEVLLVSGGGGGFSTDKVPIPSICHSTIPKYEPTSDKNSAAKYITARYIILKNDFNPIKLFNISIKDIEDNELLVKTNKRLNIIQGISSRTPVNKEFVSKKIIFHNKIENKQCENLSGNKPDFKLNNDRVTEKECMKMCEDESLMGCCNFESYNSVKGDCYFYKENEYKTASSTSTVKKFSNIESNINLDNEKIQMIVTPIPSVSTSSFLQIDLGEQYNIKQLEFKFINTDHIPDYHNINIVMRDDDKELNNIMLLGRKINIKINNKFLSLTSQGVYLDSELNSNSDLFLIPSVKGSYRIKGIESNAFLNIKNNNGLLVSPKENPDFTNDSCDIFLIPENVDNYYLAVVNNSNINYLNYNNGSFKSDTTGVTVKILSNDIGAFNNYKQNIADLGEVDVFSFDSSEINTNISGRVDKVPNGYPNDNIESKSSDTKVLLTGGGGGLDNNEKIGDSISSDKNIDTNQIKYYIAAGGGGSYINKMENYIKSLSNIAANRGDGFVIISALDSSYTTKSSKTKTDTSDSKNLVLFLNDDLSSINKVQLVRQIVQKYNIDISSIKTVKINGVNIDISSFNQSSNNSQSETISESELESFKNYEGFQTRSRLEIALNESVSQSDINDINNIIESESSIQVQNVNGNVVTIGTNTEADVSQTTGDDEIKECHRLVNNELKECTYPNICWKDGNCLSLPRTKEITSLNSAIRYKQECESLGGKFCDKNIDNIYKLHINLKDKCLRVPSTSKFSPENLRTNSDVVLHTKCGVLRSGTQFIKIPISGRKDINKFRCKIEITVPKEFNFNNRSLLLVQQFSGMYNNKYNRVIVKTDHPIEDSLIQDLSMFPHGLNIVRKSELQKYYSELVRLGINTPSNAITWKNGWQTTADNIKVGCIGGCTLENFTSIFDEKEYVSSVPIFGNKISYSLSLKTKWDKSGLEFLPDNLYLNILIPGKYNEFLFFNMTAIEYKNSSIPINIDIDQELLNIIKEQRNVFNSSDIPIQDVQFDIPQEEVTESQDLESGYSINSNKLMSFIQTHQKDKCKK